MGMRLEYQTWRNDSRGEGLLLTYQLTWQECCVHTQGTLVRVGAGIKQCIGRRKFGEEYLCDLLCSGVEVSAGGLSQS